MKPAVALTIILALIAALAWALWCCTRPTVNFPLRPVAAITSAPLHGGAVIGVKQTARARLGVGARGQPLCT